MACCVATFLLGYVSNDTAVAGFKQKLVEFGPCTLLTGVISLLYWDKHSEIRIPFHLQHPSRHCALYSWHTTGRNGKNFVGKGVPRQAPGRLFPWQSVHHKVRLPLTQTCLIQAFTAIASPFSKCLFSLEPKMYWLCMRRTQSCPFHTPSLCHRLTGSSLKQVTQYFIPQPISWLEVWGKKGVINQLPSNCSFKQSGS